MTYRKQKKAFNSDLKHYKKSYIRKHGKNEHNMFWFHLNGNKFRYKQYLKAEHDEHLSFSRKFII